MRPARGIPLTEPEELGRFCVIYFILYLIDFVHKDIVCLSVRTLKYVIDCTLKLYNFHGHLYLLVLQTYTVENK